MKRIFTVLFGMGLIVFACAAVTAVAYVVGALAEEHLFAGASRLTNIIFLMVIFVMIIATLLTVAERKWSALIQDRIGPNRARINLPGLRNAPLAGIPHLVADAVKMLTKEDFMPALASSFLYKLGPVLAMGSVVALFAVVPAGPSITLWGHRVDMVVSTPDFGLLYLLAIASLAVYGTSLAGWASNNKFALLGSVRASSQMISYEVALGLSLVGLIMAFSTVQLPALVGTLAAETGTSTGQARYLWQFTGADGGFDFGLPAWGFILQPMGFLGFFAASFAETKRAPFDAPEGDSEIIGYFVEYSGMKFGLFMISEFIEVVILAGVTAVLFFGGWNLPFGGEWLATQLKDAPLLYGTLLGTVFWLKVIGLIFVQMVIRWTFPRFRYDQIQTLGWKILLPMGLVNVFATGALVLWDPSLRYLALFGFLQIAAVLALTFSSGDEPQASHGPGAGHGALGHGRATESLDAKAPVAASVSSSH